MLLRSVVEQNIEEITNVWNDHILRYKFCNSRLKFGVDVQSNYFGDMIMRINGKSQLLSSACMNLRTNLLAGEEKQASHKQYVILL